MSEKIIMYNDPGIVEKKMVELWVVKGKNFGFNSEHDARYNACTHVKCNECGTPIRKASYCSSCWQKKQHEKFLALTCEEWGGEPFFANDRYYADLDSFLDDCANDEILNIEDIEIYSAEPCKYRQIDIYDYQEDSICEGADLPEEIIAAADALNAVLKTAKPCCFERGKIRYILPQDVVEEYKREMLENEE